MPVACAAALNAHVACHGHKGIHGAHHGPAVGVALHAVANPHCRGVGRSKFFCHRAYLMGGYARNLRRPLHGDVGPQIGRKFVKTHGPVFDKILIHKTRVQQMPGHAERKRPIAASAHLPVHIALGRSLGKDGVNNHHLGALLPGLVDVLHGVHGTPRRVRAPHDDVLGLDHVFRVIAPHVAEIIVLGVNARGPAGCAHKTAGVPEGRHHAFHTVVGDAEVAGILGKTQPQQVAVLFLQLQNLVRNPVHGFVPADSAPVARASALLNHGILDAVRAVDPPGIGIALYAQGPLSEGGFRRALHKLHDAVLDVGLNAACIVAVAGAGVAKHLIGRGVKGFCLATRRQKQRAGNAAERARCPGRQQPFKEAAPFF